MAAQVSLSDTIRSLIISASCAARKSAHHAIDEVCLTVWLHPSMQIPFQFRPEEHRFKVKYSATISDLAELLEDEMEAAGKAVGVGIKMQVEVVWSVKNHNTALNWSEPVGQHFSTGDTFGAYGGIQQVAPQAKAMQQMEKLWAVLQQKPPGWPGRDMMFKEYQQFRTEVIPNLQLQEVQKFQPGHKKPLRFALNDRVVCNLGPRWVGGHVVRIGAGGEHEWAYKVKIDPHPGLQMSRIISVPEDSDDVCFQEVCFSTKNIEQLKGAAPEVLLDTGKQKLRFTTGDHVTCRTRSGDDGLEAWCVGTVAAANAPMPGQLQWGAVDFSGVYPSKVAYRVELDSGNMVYCHADNYTLIRRAGLDPQERVKGLSKRLEQRKCPDGSRIHFDHMTENSRSRPINPISSNSESDADEIWQLTDEQKKAMYIE